MSVVKINAISVPEGAGPELEQRFAARAGAVDQQPGFEEFMLLRPVSGDDRYFVVTRWESEEAFQAWRDGQAFAKAHADGPSAAEGASGGHPGGGHPGGDTPERPPVATGASLLEFDVVSISHPPS